ACFGVTMRSHPVVIIASTIHNAFRCIADLIIAVLKTATRKINGAHWATSWRGELCEPLDFGVAEFRPLPLMPSTCTAPSSLVFAHRRVDFFPPGIKTAFEI